MAAYRKRSASALRKSKNGANESGNEIANVVATRAAPVTNHLSWSRSSPTDRRNRTTTATNAAMSPIGTPKKATVSTTPATPPAAPTRRRQLGDGIRPVLGRDDHRSERQEDRHDADEPADGSPPSRGQVTVGEEQQQEHQHPQRNGPCRVGEPPQGLPRRKRSRVDHERVDHVGLAERRERDAHTGHQEQPADPILRNPHRQDHPHDRYRDVCDRVRDAGHRP